jgi:hypothetical protein
MPAWALMYRWPFEMGGLDAAKIILVPTRHIQWRRDHGWRLMANDEDFVIPEDPGGD